MRVGEKQARSVGEHRLLIRLGFKIFEVLKIRKQYIGHLDRPES